MKRGYLLKIVRHESWEQSCPVKNFFIENENYETAILKRILTRIAKGRNFTSTQVEELKKNGNGCDFKKSKISFGFWINNAISVDGDVYEFCEKVEELKQRKK
ncbi:MAG: hypothetical protein WCO35_03405 [Candidatus Nomurabacteria bacterium]